MYIKLYGNEFFIPTSIVKNIKKAEYEDNTSLLYYEFESSCVNTILETFNKVSEEESNFICNRACRECEANFIKALKAKEVRNR